MKTSLEEHEKATTPGETETALDVVQEQLQLADQLLSCTAINETNSEDRSDAVAWLYKSALNFLLAGVKTWPPDRTADLARSAAKLAEHFSTILPADNEGIAQARRNSLTLSFLAASSEMQHLENSTGPQTQVRERFF